MLKKSSILQIVNRALAEDSVRLDLTSKILLRQNQNVSAEIVMKERGIVCGIQIAAMVFKKLDPKCKLQFYARDGQKIKTNQKIMTVTGKAIQLLSAERTALNFLQHLSGVAVLTHQFVQRVKGTKAKIYDTRKTIPGLRILQKYAVRCGGGNNHRMNLAEMAMVKDNHLKAVMGRESWVVGLKARLPKKTLLEMEAKNLREVELALKSKADIILLDNMSISQIRKAIDFIRSYHPPHPRPLPQGERIKVRVLIEVSGGVSLKNVRKIAQLGVDRISVGAITHSAPALDISMEVTKLKNPS